MKRKSQSAKIKHKAIGLDENNNIEKDYPYERDEKLLQDIKKIVKTSMSAP